MNAGEGVSGAPLAGQALLRPFVGSALAVLLVNDHLLKRRWPGLITGKLSDVAGLVFFPVLLVTLWEGLRALGRGRSGGGARLHARADAWSTDVIVAGLITAVGFSVVKLSNSAAGWYSAALGDLQWPVRAAVALARGATVHGPSPILVRADPWDLIALPAILVGLDQLRRSIRPAARGRR